jgi:hypothetical protein
LDLTIFNGVPQMFKVVHNDMKEGLSLITLRPISKGEKILMISDKCVLPAPSYQSIQISKDKHIYDNGFTQYMNHSCDPNTVIDTQTMVCLAIRDIQQFEELTFFYPSTEWEMNRPFQCRCGSHHCLGHIAGAKYLTLGILKQYYINQHILDMLLSYSDSLEQSSIKFN